LYIIVINNGGKPAAKPIIAVYMLGHVTDVNMELLT